MRLIMIKVYVLCTEKVASLKSNLLTDRLPLFKGGRSGQLALTDLSYLLHLPSWQTFSRSLQDAIKTRMVISPGDKKRF